MGFSAFDGFFWRRLWAVDTFVSSLRVFVALSAVIGLCFYLGEMEAAIPLVLGVVASALAETDDTWRGRLRALLVTLGCFAAAAGAVQALFDRPLLFIAGLSGAAFALTMLGAIGERYRAIASATLILAIYTTLGADRHAADVGPAFWRQPALLVAGAAWYGLLSVLWCALFATQPVQQNLARLFAVLGDYLRLKAQLFEPVRMVDVERKRLALAQLNGRAVAALNAAKESIFSRVGRGGPGRRISRYLTLYFIAQDVHERASSSHDDYNALAHAFFHSDVLYRCQRVLGLQGRACGRLAAAIRLRRPFEQGDDSVQAMADLRGAIAHLRAQGRSDWAPLLHSLGALTANLELLDAQLAGASRPHGVAAPEGDHALFDRSPQSMRDALDRVRLQLTPRAPLFRHALRLALALAIGYGVMHLIHASQGYWILLTTLFVIQPTYGATVRRMVQRVAGTVVGLLVGWALLRLFPSLPLQSVFTVVAGVVFFATRTTRYLVATAAVTLLVMLCFNQLGEGYDLIVPRLVDTLIGSLIAGAAVFLILPTWQGRRLGAVAGQAVGASSRYLRQIMAQYRTGPRDDLAYRLARRNAHNADAALSAAIAQLFQEPGHVRSRGGAGMRLLVLSHTLLNYVSGLGAHRALLAAPAGPGLPDASPTDAMVDRVAEALGDALDAIAADLAAGRAPAPSAGESEGRRLAQQLEALPDEADDTRHLLRAQLVLICQQLGSLAELAAQLAAAAGDAGAAVQPPGATVEPSGGPSAALRVAEQAVAVDADDAVGAVSIKV